MLCWKPERTLYWLKVSRPNLASTLLRSMGCVKLNIENDWPKSHCCSVEDEKEKYSRRHKHTHTHTHILCKTTHKHSSFLCICYIHKFFLKNKLNTKIYSFRFFWHQPWKWKREVKWRRMTMAKSSLIDNNSLTSLLYFGSTVF